MANKMEILAPVNGRPGEKEAKKISRKEFKALVKRSSKEELRRLAYDTRYLMGIWQGDRAREEAYKEQMEILKKQWNAIAW